MSALAAKLERETPSVAIIVGKEDLLIREARDMVLSSAPGGRPDSDQIQTISPQSKPDDERLQDIFDDLRTPNLFGGVPVIVLEGADRWLKSGTDAWVDFLQNPVKDSLLILISTQLDGRSKLAKSLKSSGWWIGADRPFHRPPPWKPWVCGA